MKQIIENFFISEKREAIFLIVIGAIAMVAAANCWFATKMDFWKGAAIPLFILGCVELTAGYVVYKKSDEKRIENVYAADMNPQNLKTHEIPRVESLIHNYNIARYIEIFLLIAGMILVGIFYKNPEQYFLRGIGAVLVLQSAILIIATHFALLRTAQYLKALQEFTATHF